MEKLKTFLAGHLSKVLQETVKRSLFPASLTLAVAYVTADTISWGRVITCLAGVLLLPVLVFLPIRWVVAQRSNRANAFLLAILTLTDLAFGFVAVRGRIAGWITALIVAALTLGGLFYNVGMMSFALRLEKN